MTASSSSSVLRPLRVLQVTPRFHPHVGGIETHVMEVSRRLLDQGLEVSVVTSVANEATAGRAKVGSVPVERFQAWPKSRDYCLSPGLYQRISRADCDLIHVQGVHTFVPVLAMLAAKRRGIPYVVTFHTGGHSSQVRTRLRSLQWKALRPLLASAASLVGVSQFEQRLFHDLLDLPASLFHVIPNGTAKPGIETRTPPNGSKRIVSVGRLERYKGHQRAIAAMPFVLDKEPEARLLILGSGPYEAELRSQAEALQVQQAVDIRSIPSGQREEMARELGASSLFLLLSEYEAHPIAVMEALSAGLPCLVADTSGLQEIAERGWAGSIPVSANPQRVAGAILDQLADPVLPGNVRLPTWEDCCDSLRRLYESVAGA